MDFSPLWPVKLIKETIKNNSECRRIAFTTQQPATNGYIKNKQR